MEAMTFETVKFILDNIDKSNKRLDDLNRLIEDYKFQIENVGSSSILGQEFAKNLQFLKGEKDLLMVQVKNLKKQVDDYNKATTKAKEQEEKKEVESIIKETNKTRKEYDYIKVSSVAAFRNGKILDALIVKDEKDISAYVSQLYYEYGNDINIKFNRDAYLDGEKNPVKENIGWIDLNEYYNSVKVNKKEKVVNNKVAEENGNIKNFKVVYKKGKYIIEFDKIENGKTIHKIYGNKVLTNLLNYEHLKRKVARKYNINRRTKFYRSMDPNLLLIIGQIDKDYGTSFIDDYKNGNSKIKLKYDLKGHFAVKELKFKEKLAQRKIAVNQKKFANAELEVEKNKGVLVGAISGLVLITTLGISTILPSLGKKQGAKQSMSNKNSISQQMDTVTTQDITEEQIIDNIVNKKQESITKQVNEENSGLKIGDRLVLNIKDKSGNIKHTFKLRKDLTDTSTKCLASDYNDCEHFVISSIAVVSNGKIIDEFKTGDVSTVGLTEKYQNNIDILLNFDGYKKDSLTPDYKNIGWLSVADFNNRKSDNYVKNIEVAVKEVETENNVNNVIKDYENKAANENIAYCDFDLDGKINLFSKDGNGNVTSSENLTSDAWGNGVSIDASKLGCDYFKISYIAVYDGNTVLDVKKIKDNENVDNITNEMYKRFGKNVSVSYNFNGYLEDEKEPLYKNIGWININKIVDVNEKMNNSTKNTSDSILDSKTYVKK